MGAVARELGFDGSLPELLRPENGLLYGAKKLSKLHEHYTSVSDIAAAYNAGHPKIDGITGRYANQGYVDKVLSALHQFENLPDDDGTIA